MTQVRVSSFAILLAVVCFFVVASVDGHVEESKNEGWGTVIGIDLGNTYSRVSVRRGGHVETIPNDQGSPFIDSWVSFDDDELLVGDAARNASHLNPQNTVFDLKRLIGRRVSDRDLKLDTEYWPFRVKEKKGRPVITVEYKGVDHDFSAEEIAAMILNRLKESAEAYLAENVTHAVVSVPAYFNDDQRRAIKDSGTLAGLTILRVIDEPRSTAIAYGLDKIAGESQVMVYNLGGGTFDVTLLSADDGVFEVLALAGDAHLGGQDFDNRVVDYFVKNYKEKTGTDVTNNLRAVGLLKREVEKAKRPLSTQQSVFLEIKSFEDGNDFYEPLSRTTFEELNIDHFLKTIEHVEQVLKDANIKKEDVDKVLLAGGSAHIPRIQQLLTEFFDGKKPSMEINPDEAVAYGAAIQGSILSGEAWEENLCVHDILYYPLGIETDGVFTTLISRYTPLPTKKSKIISTISDNQTVLSIQVIFGDPPHHSTLGQFNLTDIAPAPRGIPQIEVTFEILEDDRFNVSATETVTGRSEFITLTNERGRLTEEEIDALIKEAEEFAMDDAAARAAVDRLQSSLFKLQSQLEDDQALGAKVGSKDKNMYLAFIRETTEWIDDNQWWTGREVLEEKASAVEAFVDSVFSQFSTEAHPHDEL